MTLEDLLPLGMLAGPFIVGVGLRALVRASRAALAIGVLVAALLVASLPVQTLNPADVVFSALLAGVGVWVAGQSTPQRRLAALGAVGLFVATAEAAARLTTSPVPGAPSPVAVNVENMSSYCTVDATHQTRPLPTTSHYVLHLGDSMIAWAPAGATLSIDRLGATDTHVHVEAGIVGTGPDCALLILRGMPKADLVVLHLFALNDLADLDAGYAWCAGGPLFDYDTTPPTLRCPEGPTGSLTVSGRFMATPAPWLLRWARSRFALAVQITDAWETERDEWSAAWFATRTDQTEARFAKLDAILALLRDEVRARGGIFVVSLVPIRRSWLDEPVRARLVRIREVLDRAGVPSIDATRLLADAEEAGESPDTLYSRDWPDDPHLAEEGQQRYAAWLAANLTPWLKDVPPKSP